MEASIKINRSKPGSNRQSLAESQPHMLFEAMIAMILDYAAVAAVLGLFVLERAVGIRLGSTLDLVLLVVLVIVVALSGVAWLAGARLDPHLDRRHVTTRRS